MRRSRWLSMVALMTAVAVVLSGISVPAPFAVYLLYGVWEVPVVLALLVLGFRGGLLVAGLNALALEFINPGALPTAPLYNLAAELSTFVGILGAERFSRNRGMPVLVAAASVAGAAVRTSTMTVVNWLVLPQPPPIGFSLPQASVPATLVLIAVFNATTVLYVVPGAYTIRRAIASRTAYLKGLSNEGFTP